MTVAPEPDNSGDSVSAPTVPDYTESEDYPVLQFVLLAYFPNQLEARADRSREFVDKYLLLGESSAEFEGLEEELRKAIRSPKSVTPMLNEALGMDLEPMEVRMHLTSLWDQIRGDLAVAEAEVAEAEEKIAKASPDDLMENYFFRRVRIPWIPWLRDREVPLWSVLAGSFVSILLGLGVYSLPLPSWTDWFPLLLIVGGLVVMGLTATAMSGLREEIRRPEKEAKRNKALAEANARKAERQANGRKLRDLL